MKKTAHQKLGAHIIRSTGGHLAVRMNAMITKKQEAEIRAVLDFHWNKIEGDIVQGVADVLGTELRRGK